jgi:2-iminobutanoate/2-iminopropanoate deaminase
MTALRLVLPPSPIERDCPMKEPTPYRLALVTLAVFLGLALLGCACNECEHTGEQATAPAPGLELVASTEAPPAIGPYGQGVKAGGFLFTSGQIPLTPGGEMVEGDIVAQTEQVLANLDAVLKEAGCERTDVVKATVFLSDLADFRAMNEVYAAFFGEHRPARSTVEVARLARDVRIEVDLVARLPH